MDLPSVFSYLDYRSFLRDWFDARKRQESDYSYARFSEEGGCSKSALANVLSGARTPRAGTLDAFGRAMSLAPSERNYLGLLVELSSAEDLDRRRQAMERILASERYQQFRQAESESESSVFRYVEHWYVPAVRELASLPGFRPDGEWIAATLRPPISVREAQDALDRLFELDFLHLAEDGSVELREVQFRSEPDTTRLAIMHFHREQVPVLLRHVDSRDGEMQHLAASTVTLPASIVPEIKARIDTLVRQTAAMADAAPPDEGTRVYQLAVQLLPVSEVVD